MARYDKYGNLDDRTLEDLDLGFTGYNNRLRSDQLQRGTLSSSVNGRLDRNGEWQVRKGITNVISPFTVAGNAVRLPTSSEEETGTRLRLPFTISAATVSTNVVTITTGAIAHGLTTGDKVVIEGLKKSDPGHTDPNGERTITGTPTTTTFTFDLTTTATSYVVTEGIVLTWEAFPQDPVNWGSASSYAQINQHLFLPHTGGSLELTLNDATNTEVTSSCRFSDNAISTDEFVILSSVTNAVAVNVNDSSKFNMTFEAGETVPLASQLLQVLNKIILFRNEQAALECNKFFKQLDIASATRPGSSRVVTVNTTVAHGLETGDFIGIENLSLGNEDPNGSFVITKVDLDTFTYQVANTSPSGSSDDYSAVVGAFGHTIPAFKKVPSGQYTQPIEVATQAGEYAQVENRGVVHKNPDNYVLGDELEFLGEIHDTNVSGLVIGSNFNVSKVFTLGDTSAIGSSAAGDNSHGNPEYGTMYRIVFTATGHGLSVGDPITIVGTSQGALNADWFVAEVPDANTFTIYKTSNTAISSGGTVRIAEGFEFFIQSEKTSVHVTEGDSYLAQPVFSKRIALSMGFRHMPNPPYGIYHQKRLVVPFFFDVSDTGLTTDRGNRDELIVSDLLDTDTYDEVFGQFRFNAGGADFNVGMHSFSEDVLVVFNRNSIHLVVSSLNLQTAAVKNLTNEVGCIARKSIIQVGNRILFLSDNGVYAIDFQDEYNLRGNEMPLSEPINVNVQNINKDNASKATAVYFDNRYYIAVPMNYVESVNTSQVFFSEREALEYVDPITGLMNTFDASDTTKNLVRNVSATENNVILIYNFLNNAWESIDYVSEQSSSTNFAINPDWNILDLVVAGRGDARGVYVVNSKGGVHRLDIGLSGTDSVITEIGVTDSSSKNTNGFATTRMYNLNSIDRKRFENFEILAESSVDASATFRLGAVAENLDSEFLLNNGNAYSIATKGEDVAIRGRIGNKRAYGMEFKLQNTTGRPRFKGFKVAASETFRSINEAR